MFYFDILKELFNRQIQYIIVGGLAVNLYGITREDLMNPEIVKTWIIERNLKALSFYHREDNYKGIDIVLVHPLDFTQAFENKTSKRINNTEIYLVSIDDLITMKAVSSRSQDLSDIEMLKKVKQFLEEE